MTPGLQTTLAGSNHWPRPCMRRAGATYRALAGSAAGSAWSQNAPCCCRFLVMVVMAVICWPVGALIWLCDIETGNAIMGTPAKVHQDVYSSILF